MTEEETRALEERAFNAWPAMKSVFYGGWVFRISDGFTRRANSANAIDPGVPFPEVRDAAEKLYAEHGLPAAFRLTPLAPPSVDEELQRAGYDAIEPTLVLIAPLEAGRLDADVIVESTPTNDWLRGFAAATAIDSEKQRSHQRIVSAIALPRAFVTIFQNGRPAGFGLAVYERAAVGIFGLIVDRAERGRGKGRELTLALLEWGRRAGAQSAYLQVSEGNAVARRLYESLGFRTAYRYHYRVPPRSDGGASP
jgi:ribosomal protein S18 acetylase RimI-like enzyme